jgi:hypothetical protein
MGTACILNAKRCGRTHCRYTGPYYLAMIAPVGLLGSDPVSAGIYAWLLDDRGKFPFTPKCVRRGSVRNNVAQNACLKANETRGWRPSSRPLDAFYLSCHRLWRLESDSVKSGDKFRFAVHDLDGIETVAAHTIGLARSA